MLRAKMLGAIEFVENTLFIEEEFNDNSSSKAEVVLSATGEHIVYEMEILTPYITLNSRQYGWISEDQRDSLVLMRKQLDTTFVLTYDDGTTETVRFAREKDMVFESTFEGSDKYTAIIPLAKID